MKDKCTGNLNGTGNLGNRTGLARIWIGYRDTRMLVRKGGERRSGFIMKRVFAVLSLAIGLALGIAPLAAFGDSPDRLAASNPAPSGGLQASALQVDRVSKLERTDLSKARVKFAKSRYTFTGHAITPKPKVSLAKKTLKFGRDYAIAYKRNVKAGQASVVVTGKNNYSGKALSTFTITPKPATLTIAKSFSGCKATVRAAKAPGAKGYQFKISRDKAGIRGKRLVVSESRTHVFAKLRQGGEYYVRARAFTQVNGKRVWGDWSKAEKLTVKYKPAWKLRDGYYWYRQSNGEFATGLVDIGGKTYVFDEWGHQRTGWYHVGGGYRFFYRVNGTGGYMARDCVVNGIKLRRNGVAVTGGAASAELYVMCRAQLTVDAQSKPTESRYERLWKAFNYLKYDCEERLTRTFSNYEGWHRDMALDVFDGQTGSCFSYGAAFAYMADVIGYENCTIVSSGGHGWAEIDGMVYDAEWSRHYYRDLFCISYDESGSDGMPAYSANRAYVVQIAPNTSRW